MAQLAKRRRRKPAAAKSDVLTLAEAARFLRLPAKTVERLVLEQGLPGRKVGKEWRFLRTAIERWLEPAKAQRGSVLDQFGALANDPTYDEFRKVIEENRRRLNEEVA